MITAAIASPGRRERQEKVKSSKDAFRVIMISDSGDDTDTSDSSSSASTHVRTCRPSKNPMEKNDRIIAKINGVKKERISKCISMVDADSFFGNLTKADGPKYLPFYSCVTPSMVYRRPMIWTGKTPFDNDCEDETDNNEEAAVLMERKSRASSSRSVEIGIPSNTVKDGRNESVKRRKTKTTKEPKRRRLSTEESNDSGSIISPQRNVKPRRIRILSSSDEEEQASADSSTISIRSIPPGFTKECSVVLESLSSEILNRYGYSPPQEIGRCYSPELVAGGFHLPPVEPSVSPNVTRPDDISDGKLMQSTAQNSNAVVERENSPENVEEVIMENAIESGSENPWESPMEEAVEEKLDESKARKSTSAKTSSTNFTPAVGKTMETMTEKEVKKIKIRRSIVLDNQFRPVANVASGIRAAKQQLQSRLSASSSSERKDAISALPRIPKLSFSKSTEKSIESTIPTGLVGVANGNLKTSIPLGRPQLKTQCIERKLSSVVPSKSTRPSKNMSSVPLKPVEASKKISSVPAKSAEPSKKAPSLPQDSGEPSKKLSAIPPKPVEPSKKIRLSFARSSGGGQTDTIDTTSSALADTDSQESSSFKRPLRIWKKKRSADILDLIPSTVSDVSNSTDITKKSILKSTSNSDSKEKTERNKRKVTFSEEPEIRYFESVKSKRDSGCGSNGGNNSDGWGSKEAPVLGVQDEIISAILKWNPDWLQEAKRMHDGNMCVQPPPIAPESWSLMQVQNSYDTIGPYLDTYKILLLHEIWEKLFREFLSRPLDGFETLDCLVVNVNAVAMTFKDFNVVALVDKDKVCRIQENVLVSFCLVDRKLQTQQREPVFFGLILRSTWSTYRRVDEVTPELRKCAKVNEDNVKRFCHVEMTVRARSKTNLPNLERGAMLMQLKSDMSSVIRLVTALSDLRSSHLQPFLLAPNKIAHPPAGSIDGLLISSQASCKYDDGQLKVISSCVSALSDETQPVIRLISGPAGSGKSQTIIGLIEEIQLRRVQNKDFNGVVLVAAPTSESVDDLCRRILALNRFHLSGSGCATTGQTQSRFLKFLRLGQRTTVAEDVARYCMGSLVENNMRTEEEAATTQSSDETRSQITERLAYLKGQLYSFTESQLPMEDQVRQKELETEIGDLQLQLKLLGDSRNRRQIATQDQNTASYLKKYLKNTEPHRERLILHADVIAFTLNKDGRDFDLIKKMHRNGTIKVLCAIVDDACKASELQTLTVAYSPIRKLLLFGREDRNCNQSNDILATVSKEYGYGTSLFTRNLCNFASDLAPVLPLPAQNRLDAC